MRHLLFFWFLLTGSLALGQTSVQITVTALPPFDPFLQDYFYQPGKLQVLVRNTTTTQLTIKLQASLTGDNGVEVATLPGYQPVQPLVLQPMQARFLTVADVKNMVDLSQVSVQGFDKAALLRGKALPEGEYQLCLQAIDLQTNRPLSPAETGCTRIPVRSVEPPILIAPLCDHEIKPQIPQNLVFTWAPPAGVLPSKVEYTLRIVELPLLEADPNVFIDAVVLPATGVEVKNLKINTFLYSVVQPALKPGRKYAWRVQARDPMGKLLFLNDGKSPVCSFQYGEIVVKSQKLDKPIALSPKTNGLNGKLIQAVCPNGQLVITNTISQPNAGTALVTLPQDRTVIEVQPDGSGKVVIQKAGTKIVVSDTENAQAASSSQTTNSGDVLTVGNGADLVLSWMADPKLLLALSQYSGKKDSANVRSIVQNIPNAHYEISIFGAKGNGAFGFAIPAETPFWVGSSTNEFYSFDPDQAGFPLQFGQRYWYRVRLVLPQIALLMLKEKSNFTDESGLTSDLCTFVLKQKPPNYEDYVVSGLLRYQFDGFPGNFPAPNTTVSIRFKKPDGVFGRGPAQLDYLGKTDENGVFRVRIPRKSQIGEVLAKADNKNAVSLNYTIGLPDSKYYQAPVPAQAKDFFLKTNDPDSTDIGPLLADAYAYRLKVVVKKRFDKLFVEALTGIDEKTGTVKAGTQTIDAGGLTKVDNSLTEALVGIKIHLYRKAKPAYLPPVEGQLGLTQLDPLANGCVPVSQGTTTLEIKADGSRQAVVVFDRLLPTVNPGDEYYIQAETNPKYGIVAGTAALFANVEPLNTNLSANALNVNGLNPNLAGSGDKKNLLTDFSIKDAALGGKKTSVAKPDPDQAGNNVNMSALPNYFTAKETFVAPEDTVSLSYAPFVNPNALLRADESKTYRSASKEYGVLTSRPPSSRVKGRLVYTWPNRSEKFVMANMPFVIRVGYSGDGKTVLDGLGTTIEDPEECEVTKGTKISIEGVPTTTTGDGKQTIAFSTEDDGHIVAAGTTDANGYFDLDVVNLNQKGEVLVNATIKTEQITKGYPCPDPNQVPVAGKVPALQTAKEKYLDPIWNPGPDDNFQAKGLAEFVVTDYVTDGMNNSTPGFLAANGQVNTPKTALPGGNQALPGQKGKGGPAATDEPPAEPVADLSISRVFFVDVQSPFYDDPGKAIVVNAFQATDAGEFSATVRQWTNVPKVFFKNSNPVKGARVVVYRQRGLDKYEHLPELEGDGLKKYQPLPANAKNGAALPPGGPQASTEAVDYFGEGFTNEIGSLVWTTKPGPLLLSPKYYRFYALPNSAQDVVVNQNSNGNVEGGYFAPKIQKADSDFRVDIANSRLIVRLLDPGKQSGLVDQKNFSQGLAGMVTLVVSGLKGGTDYTTLYTKDDGYLEIDISAYWTNSDTDTQKKLKFAVNTYVYGYNGPGKVEFEGIYAGQQVVKNIQFTPGTTITGRIMGGTVKAGKTTYTPQPSFLIRADSSVSETGTDGRFTLDVPTTNDQQLVIRPRDPAYWDDTLTLDLVGKKSPVPLDDRVLQRRQHRMRFVLLDQATNKPISGAIVALPDIDIPNKAQTTGPDGVALFDFENVSISNYRVQVRGKSTNFTIGLVNQTFEVVNVESKTYITYTVRADMGATITGIVRLDGVAVKGARVYLDYKMTAEPSIIQQGKDDLAGKPDADSTDSGAIETYSGTDGSFTLRGVPIDNATVSIRATLGNPGALYQGKNVIGDVKLVTIKNKTGGPVSLSLTSYGGMAVTSALGFPLTVEALKPNPDGTVTVTGQLDLRKSQTGFTWLEGAEVVRIRDVKFKPVANGGAKPKAVPVDKGLVLEGLTGLKFRYAQRYNVEIQNVPTIQQAAQPLRILADNDGRGQLMGKVQIVDNSFQYPSTYMNFEEGSQFFLSNLAAPGSNTVLVGGVVVTKPTEEPATATSTAPAQKPDFASLKADNKLLVLSALSNDLTFNAFAANPAPTVTTYGICGPDGRGIDFSLLNFATTADPTRSFFDADGKIHLSVWLDCKIPNAQPARFDVNIDNLVLDNQSIYPKAGSKPLQIGFEAWTLQVKNWTLDPKQGGITAMDLDYGKKSITMQTNQVDIPFGEFVLRPDIFRLNYPRLSNLDVGGVASLSVVDPTSAIFTYDVAFSGEGRWKLSIPGVGGKPAATLKISTAQNSTMLGDKPINFDYVQVLSNNQTIMSLTEKQTFFVKGNSLAGFAPTQFASGAGYLDLAGQFRVVDAPRVPSVPMTINLFKSAPPKFSPLPNDFGFEVKGHAAFKIRPGDNNLLIDKDRIIIPGAVEEAGATPKLNAEFRASAAHKSYPYFLQVLNQTGVQVGNMILDVVATTSAQANKTDWQKPLVFVGQLYQTGPNAQLKQAADGNVLQFSVYGDMHVNQLDKNGLQADSVFSKGGNLSLKPDGSFSLDKMPLFGSGKDANGMLSLSNRGVGVDALKTPFGEVKLFFDFKMPRLVGSIRIAKIQAYDAGVQGGGSEPDTNPGTPENPQPIDLGPFKVMGQGSMLLDKNGMYFVASLMAIGDVIPPPIQGVNLGVGIGYRNYEPDAITMLMGASTDPLLICKIGSEVRGLFIGAGVTLFHKEKSVPFVVGKAWFKADANLTASAKIDIGSPGIMFSAGANASAEAGIQLLCASASVGLGVFGDMTGKITYPLALCAAATIGVRARLEIDACGLFGTYTLDKYFALVGQVKKHSGQKVQFDFDIDSFDGPLDAGKCDFICPCANFTASK